MHYQQILFLNYTKISRYQNFLKGNITSKFLTLWTIQQPLSHLFESWKSHHIFPKWVSSIPYRNDDSWSTAEGTAITYPECSIWASPWRQTKMIFLTSTGSGSASFKHVFYILAWLDFIVYDLFFLGWGSPHTQQQQPHFYLIPFSWNTFSTIFTLRKFATQSFSLSTTLNKQEVIAFIIP